MVASKFSVFYPISVQWLNDDVLNSSRIMNYFNSNTCNFLIISASCESTVSLNVPILDESCVG